MKKGRFLILSFVTVLVTSIFSVMILFALTKEINGVKTALLASLMYAVSLELTLRSRDLPHPMVMFFLML